MSANLLAALGLLLVLFHVCSAQVDKSKAVGPCIDGICPPKHFCAPDNECYPKERKVGMQKRQAEGSAVSIGSCVNGLCPNGFECINNTCFKSKSPAIPAGQSIGPCVNGKCPDGFTCKQSEYKCYAN